MSNSVRNSTIETVDMLRGSDFSCDDYPTMKSYQDVSSTKTPLEKAKRELFFQKMKLAGKVALAALTALAIGAALYFTAPVSVPIALGVFLALQLGGIAWSSYALAAIKEAVKTERRIEEGKKCDW